MSERIVTNPAQMAAHWRVAMSGLANLFLTMHRTFSAPMGLGPTELLIYATIAVANVQKLMRERCIPPGYSATEILPREWVVPISRNAIASGLLIEDARGGVTTAIGMIQDQGLEPLLAGLLAEFTRTTESLLRTGVIEVQPG